MSLPDPGTVVARASGAAGGEGERSGCSGATVNVAVAGEPDPAAVAPSDEGYEGAAAGPMGRLAAAVEVAGDEPGVRLHHADPDYTATGPWLVLAPLSGVVSTVATGTGRVEVDLEYDPGADPTLQNLDDRLDALTEAARPRHEHYPVEQDEQGVFTTGTTTFALESLAVDDGLRATLSVSTTPATTVASVESRFAEREGVREVWYEPVTGVERASPSATLREVVETAHREVVGDAQYEWLRAGDVFAQIPGGEKVALGTGAPGAEAFSREEYETCVALLRETVAALGVEA